MPTLFFGILVLVLVLWGLNAYSKADPKLLVKVVRPSSGILAIGAAALLFFRGHLEVAIPLGLTGLGLLGWGPFASTGWFQRTQKTPGQVSRVRSPFVEMELDHDSGAMRGTILAGRHQGASLDSLEVTVLLGLLTEFDADSRALLAAYLDRREPGWREHAQGDTASGQGAESGPARTGTKMTEEQAYQVLGVPAGAEAAEIKRAHRALMKKLHPDQGGSTFLAAQINEAKEVLLRRHR
ncbi:MAG: molecular chaperone DnaJ [Xanthobacteraceae bacterium]|nr:molecular chaperone DnaJ [Xanthobacteraceae bacterium]